MPRRLITLEVLYNANDGKRRNVGDVVSENVQDACGYMQEWFSEDDPFAAKAEKMLELCEEDLESTDCEYSFESDDYLVVVSSENMEDDNEEANS